MQIQATGLEDAQGTLEDIEDKADDITPLLKELTNHLKNVTEESFENQKTPEGNNWTPIKPRKNDNTPTKILYDTGHMQDTLYANSFMDSAVVGVNTISKGYQYPLVHQFGTDKAGRGNKTKIVARPFMPIKKSGELYENVQKDLEEIVDEYFELEETI